VFYGRHLDPFRPLGINGSEARAADHGLAFPTGDFGGGVGRAILELKGDRESHAKIINFINAQIERAVAMREIEIIKQFKQVILQGPPGTGKTYVNRDVLSHPAGRQKARD
jgi:Cdc6-like AAA superfamily ATPase